MARLAAVRAALARARLARRWAYRAVAVLAVSIGAARPAWCNSSGPPIGYTGAPGDNVLACAQCHAHFNLGDGSVGLVGPSFYIAGDTLQFEVALRKLGQRRWGFQLTAITRTREPAGMLLVTDPSRTQLLSAFNGRQFIEQNGGGTDFGVPDAAPGWNFRWVAPPAGTGTVTFYFAGNAADGDFRTSGDFVYTGSFAVREESSSVQSRTWSAVKNLYSSGR